MVCILARISVLRLLCPVYILSDFTGCRAGVDPVWNFTWVDTEFNSQDMQRCPGGEGGEMLKYSYPYRSFVGGGNPP